MKTILTVEATADSYNLYSEHLGGTVSVAELLFKPYTDDLTARFERERAKCDLEKNIRDAQSMLDEWSRSGKRQSHTKDTLADALLRRKIANEYHADMAGHLMAANLLHDGIVRYSVEKNLAHLLREEGKKGHTFGLVELSARLAPALTFPGSSDYFTATVVPYGRDVRSALGERHSSTSFVSAEVATESARNASRLFDADRVIAETSAAPTNDVKKSGKKPEIYICSLINGKFTPEFSQEYHEIDVPFREQFDSIAREAMFRALKRMYAPD